MRCFYIADGRIAGVEFLEPGTDEELIHQARNLFQVNAAKGYQGFEVWDGKRFVHRYDGWPATGDAARKLRGDAA